MINRQIKLGIVILILVLAAIAFKLKGNKQFTGITKIESFDIEADLINLSKCTGQRMTTKYCSLYLKDTQGQPLITGLRMEKASIHQLLNNPKKIKFKIVKINHDVNKLTTCVKEIAVANEVFFKEKYSYSLKETFVSCQSLDTKKEYMDKKIPYHQTIQPLLTKFERVFFGTDRYDGWGDKISE